MLGTAYGTGRGVYEVKQLQRPRKKKKKRKDEKWRAN
jgi:hypothetical protein